MKNKMPKVGTKEFNELSSAYFGGKPKQETLLGKTISKKDADKDSFGICNRNPNAVDFMGDLDTSIKSDR